MEVVGVKFLDFLGENGERIQGTKIHCLCDDISPSKGSGREVFSFFVQPDKCPKAPVPGDKISVEYNRWGRIQSVTVC